MSKKVVGDANGKGGTTHLQLPRFWEVNTILINWRLFEVSKQILPIVWI